jgi:hypothetical protein
MEGIVHRTYRRQWCTSTCHSAAGSHRSQCLAQVESHRIGLGAAQRAGEEHAQQAALRHTAVQSITPICITLI